MKAISTLVSSDLKTTPTLILKITAFSLLTLSLFFAFKHFSDATSFQLPLRLFPSATTAVAYNSSSVTSSVSSSSSSAVPSPAPDRFEAVKRTGLVDENGAMTADFVVGEFDPAILENVVNVTSGQERKNDDGSKRNNSNSVAKIGKFRVCDEKLREYVPCLDNVDVISKLNSTERGEKYERHCPEKGRVLDCLVPRPKDYKLHIPWPQSRDQVWFANVPHTRLVEDKGGQNWISRKEDKFIFPGGGTQFIHGANKYLDQISEMIPDIAFGRHVRVALDVGCGVASFGAFLLDRNVTTLSIAPKDVHENQIQFALERGVPAMIAVFGTHRLLYPSQAFDLVHCSRCRINWTRDDGILLLEVDRMLRAGGYFVWAAQPVYKHEENLQVQWKEMEDLTGRICWRLVNKEGYIAIWQKPLNNSCYLSRDHGAQPPVCDARDDPDNVWYVGLKACISQLPDNGYGANVTTWPTRLHYPPDRLFTIKMDAYMSRKDIYKAESKYWNDIVSGYAAAFHLKKLNVRNVMDMRAGYGGYAAALHDLGFDCWVMNVVPVSGPNTLPLIYDRGLVGVVHDWCEAFDTYPRTYDLINAAGVFSVEKNRCNITNIMLEVDRILRPGGRVYIRDMVTVIDEVQEIANAMGWMTILYDTGEGPHASWKLLHCEKRL